MLKRLRKSAVGGEQTAFSDIEDESGGRGGSSPAARSSRKPNKKQQEECDAIGTVVPADIVRDLLKRMNPKEAVRLSSVCRYWRSPALAFNPTLRPTPWMVAMARHEDRLLFRLQSAADAGVFVMLNSIDVPPGTARCLGSWHGWFVLNQAPRRDRIFLLNPFSRVRISLPPHPGLCTVLCVTSDCAAPGCAVIACNFNMNPMVCRPGDKSWSVGAGVCRICVFSLVVYLKERLFVLDPNNMLLLVLQLFPLRCKDVLRVSLCHRMDGLCPYLVESQGDVLLIDTSAQPIRVSRLDWDAMAFVAVQSLGADRAVFLGNAREAFSVSAREAGCTADCIYFYDGNCSSQSRDRFSWHCYNLKEGTVVSVPNRSMPLPKFCPSVGKFWITPTMKNNYSHF